MGSAVSVTESEYVVDTVEDKTDADADAKNTYYDHHDIDLRRLLATLTEFERVYITKAVADVPKRQYYRVKTVYRHLTKYLPSLPANPNLRYKIKIVREIADQIASHGDCDDDKTQDKT